MDDTPHLTFRDTDTNVAYQFHVDSATATEAFGLYRGTDASGIAFTTVTPVLTFDSSDNAIVRAGGLRAYGDVAGDSLTTLGALIANSATIDKDITAGEDITATGVITGGSASISGTASIGTISTSNNIQSAPKHLRFNIFDPNSVQSDDGEVCLIPETDAPLTVTKITVTLDASGNEIAGDLKYADTFIGLANATVINDFDTTSGVREDDSITSGSVPAGKCVYISFDSAPNAAITQACFDVQYDYD
jgi:hypothetical protein